MCAVNCDAIGNSMLKRISESCLDTKDHLGPASFMGEKKIQMERSKVGLEHFTRDSETPFSILSNFLPLSRFYEKTSSIESWTRVGGGLLDGRG